MCTIALNREQAGGMWLRAEVVFAKIVICAVVCIWSVLQLSPRSYFWPTRTELTSSKIRCGITLSNYGRRCYVSTRSICPRKQSSALLLRKSTTLLELNLEVVSNLNYFAENKLNCVSQRSCGERNIDYRLCSHWPVITRYVRVRYLESVQHLLGASLHILCIRYIDPKVYMPYTPKILMISLCSPFMEEMMALPTAELKLSRNNSTRPWQRDEVLTKAIRDGDENACTSFRIDLCLMDLTSKAAWTKSKEKWIAPAHTKENRHLCHLRTNWRTNLEMGEISHNQWL